MKEEKPGTFRKVYREIKQENADLIRETKEQAEVLEALFKTIPGREMALALTNLEQALMWSTKAIVLHDEKEQHSM